MKRYKNIAATFLMIGILTLGSSFANAGILINDFNGSERTKTEQPCTNPDEKIDYGILINDIIGILINDFTGILINDVRTTTVDCGILIND